MRGAPDPPVPSPAPGRHAHRAPGRSRARPAHPWRRPPASRTPRPVPADALTVPVGPALRGAAARRARPRRCQPTEEPPAWRRRLFGPASAAARAVARLLPRGPWDRRLLVPHRAGLVAAAVLGPVLAFALGYLFFAVPTPDDAVNNQVALVSYADGSQLTRLVPEQGNRIEVPLEQVPPAVREAVLAAEDRSFYSNPGFDLTGIVRAAWNQLRGGVGGGSTITQQYVKNTLVGDEATLWRKYKEMVVAVKISQERSKDEILGDYLNAIYFGRGAYGIQSAARPTSAGRCRTLTPAEGALLAGLIQSPSRWDPALNPDRAVQRWNFVLDGMVAQGWLAPADRAAADVPGDGAAPAVGGRRARRRPRAHRLGGERRAGGPRHHRAGARPGGPADHHDDRPAPSRPRPSTPCTPGWRGSPPTCAARWWRSTRQTGGVLAYYGGDNGLGLDYARVGGWRGRRSSRSWCSPACSRSPPVGLGRDLRRRARAGPAQRRGRRVRALRPQAGDDGVEQRRVQHPRQAGRPAGGRRRGAGRRDHRAARRPRRGHRAGQQGGQHASTSRRPTRRSPRAGCGTRRTWCPRSSPRTAGCSTRRTRRASGGSPSRWPATSPRRCSTSPSATAWRCGRRPVAAKTGTVQSRFAGENNDAWMAGFTPQLASSVWMGTDRNSPIRTATGDPISGRTLPGEVWQGFMADGAAGRARRGVPPVPAAGDPAAGAPTLLRLRRRPPHRPRPRRPGTDPTTAPTAAPPGPDGEQDSPDDDGRERSERRADARDGEPAEPAERAGDEKPSDGEAPAAPAPEARPAPADSGAAGPGGGASGAGPRAGPAPAPAPAPDCSVTPCG